MLMAHKGSFTYKNETRIGKTQHFTRSHLCKYPFHHLPNQFVVSEFSIVPIITK